FAWALGALLTAGWCMAAEPSTQPAAPELRPILSPEQKRQQAVELIERFVARVKDDQAVSAEARSAVAEGWQQYREDPEPQEFLPAALAIVNESFKKATSALEAEEYDEADAAFAQVTDASDPYVS